jgi:hypothetical protein
MSQKLRRHSGLQKQVLSLYRQFLTSAYKRPAGPGRDSLLGRVRDEFKEGAKMSRFEVDSIERRLSMARKQLKMLNLPGTEAVQRIGP